MKKAEYSRNKRNKKAAGGLLNNSNVNHGVPNRRPVKLLMDYCHLVHPIFRQKSIAHILKGDALADPPPQRQFPHRFSCWRLS